MFATRRVTAEIFSTIDVPPREWQYVQHRSRRRASKGWGSYQPCKASCSSSVGIRGRALAHYRHSPGGLPPTSCSPSSGWFGGAVHCHLVRSHSAFAIVADGFDRTSFHGLLAKRLLLRGGRLLKYIGVAAVVAAREINGCGFPAQVAVNALVIDVKLSGHVFRVLIRNVGHRCSFVSYTRTTPSHRRRGRGSRGWVLLLDSRHPTRLSLVIRENDRCLHAHFYPRSGRRFRSP